MFSDHDFGLAFKVSACEYCIIRILAIDCVDGRLKSSGEAAEMDIYFWRLVGGTSWLALQPQFRSFVFMDAVCIAVSSFTVFRFPILSSPAFLLRCAPLRLIMPILTRRSSTP